MKKIIIALDGEHFPQGAFEFAKYLNLQAPVLLAGVFLSPVDYSKVLAFSGVDGVTLLPEWLTQTEDEELVNKNILLFRDACEKEGISYRVHKDNNLMALSSLLEESRFADMLLVSSELFFRNAGRQPNIYLEEVLKKSECPVMLIPEKFEAPRQLVLTYDGSESSVFAIKQFAYLLPELCEQECMLLSISGHAEDSIPDYGMATELLARHYPQLQLQHLVMNNKTDFVNWMKGRANSYIIMGSFSRSLFSELFRKSFAAAVIRDIPMPIFISHK
ncbi:MAG: hypothetical protein U0X40_10415 [Ferruginibacter sp.]